MIVYANNHNNIVKNKHGQTRMRRIKHNFMSSSKFISLFLSTLTLSACGDGDESSTQPTDPVIQVVAQDALLNTELGNDGYKVDLSSIVLSSSSTSAFRLSDVSLVNSDSSCQPTTVEEQSFTVSRSQAKVCDYEYAVAANNQTTATTQSSAMVRVVVSNDSDVQLPALSQVTLINESDTTTDSKYSYEPLKINLIDELNALATDVSGLVLSSSVSQPFAKGSTVTVDTTNHVIEYIPAPGESGLDRLMYSYTDTSAGEAYSGTIDIAIAENANQGIELLIPNAIYGLDGKTYVPLADAKNGVEIDVYSDENPYVESLDGDDIQLIYVKSLTAPQTGIDSANEDDPTNTKFTFTASTQNVHYVTYVVSDHKGSYQIGHVSVTVLDENQLPPWVDVTHAPSNTLFYAPKSLNVAIANSYPFDASISTRVLNQNYKVAGLYHDYVTDYCEQLGAELATSEEIKSLVDRGWLNTALWPTGESYLVNDRLSGALKLIDIAEAAYSIDTTTLATPNDDQAYFPACVVRADITDRMLTSLQLTAKQRAGTTSISVPNGKSLNTLLTGYFNDGSVENDMWAFDSTLTTFEQSNPILNRDSQGFTAHTLGNTELYGQYNASADPLRSNITQVEVTDAIATDGTLSVSSTNVPAGSGITLDGQIVYSDSTSASVASEANITWVIDSSEYTGPGSHPYVDSITYNGSTWTLVASSTEQGSFTINWLIDGISSNEKTITVVDAVVASLESIVAKDSITLAEANSFPIGRSFYFTVMGKFTDGIIRDVTADIQQADWEYNSGYVTQSDTSFNQFTGHTAHSWDNTCGGVGVPMKAWINGLSICASVEITDAYLTSVSLSPETKSFAKGLTEQLTATGLYSDNTLKSVNSLCSWISSKPSIAAVTQTGSVSASEVGNSTITATCSTPYGDVSDSSEITVTAAELVSIVASPTSWRMSRFETQTLKAMGTYTDGDEKDISTAVSWSSTTTPSTLSISGNSVTIGLNPRRDLSINFIAKLDGKESNEINLRPYNSFIVPSMNMKFTFPSMKKVNQSTAEASCQYPNTLDYVTDWDTGSWLIPSQATLRNLHASGRGPDVFNAFYYSRNDNGEEFGTNYWTWNTYSFNKGGTTNIYTGSNYNPWRTDAFSYMCYQSY